jgi:hypothetical protein
MGREDEIIQARERKLEEIKNSGIDPYPQDSRLKIILKK